MPSDCQDVEVEHGTIRLGVTSQGSPVESRYLTSAILPKRLSCSASRGPALVFAPFLGLRSAVNLDDLENDTLMYVSRSAFALHQDSRGYFGILCMCFNNLGPFSLLLITVVRRHHNDHKKIPLNILLMLC